MKYYKIQVSFVVAAEDEYTARLKAITGKTLLHKIREVERAPDEIEATLSQLIESRPEKGLW